MRVLVTGGAGFIGSHFVRSLIAGNYPAFAGADIVVLDKLTYAGNLANLAPVESDISFVRGDIGDRKVLDEMLPGVEVVVNFAAETHVDRSITGASDFVVTNVLGTQTLLEASLTHRVGRFLHVSTDEVYGSIESGSWLEDHVLEPNSPYSASKAAADLLVLSYGKTYGLDVVITRCSNNYGPYQFPEKVIPLFVTNLIDGAKIPLYGDGLNIRDWLHVADHCSGIMTALEKGETGNVYNIGGGTELTNRALTERILSLTGHGWEKVEPVTDRLGHDRRYSVDSSKLAALGYAPAVSFDEGLAATVSWYQANEQWWRPLRERRAVAVAPLPAQRG